MKSGCDIVSSTQKARKLVFFDAIAWMEDAEEVLTPSVHWKCANAIVASAGENIVYIYMLTAQARCEPGCPFSKDSGRYIYFLPREVV